MFVLGAASILTSFVSATVLLFSFVHVFFILECLLFQFLLFCIYIDNTTIIVIVLILFII